MQEKKDYNAAIYARLSKEDEKAGDSVSIGSQVAMLTKYVADKGWNLAATFKDDGYSGTNFDNRPAFQEMMSKVRKGEINLVVVKDLSRFGRDYIEVGQYIDIIFPSLGCRFIAVNDNVDTLSKGNDMLAIFKNVMNDFYARDTSAKIRAVRQSSCRSGKYVGAFAPYGYVKNPADRHRLIIDGPAAAVVRRIFTMRAEGLGCPKIARTLNAERILPPRSYYFHSAGKPNPYAKTNGKWNDRSVKLILCNEAYLGHTVQHKEERFSYKDHRAVPVPEEEWIRVEGTHEPIISRELWEQCRQVDRMHSRPRQTKLREVSLFSGLAFCADCGFAMRCQVRKRRRRDGSTAYDEAYMCGSYSRSGKTACSTHYIPLHVLSDLVLSDLWAKSEEVCYDEEGVTQRLVRHMQSQEAMGLAAVKKSISMAEKRLAELERLIQCTYEDKVLGKLPEGICISLMSRYQEEQAEKTLQLQELGRQLQGLQDAQNDVQEWVSLIRQCRNIDTLDRDMLLKLIDRVEIGEVRAVDGKKEREIRIHYKFVGYIG